MQIKFDSWILRLGATASSAFLLIAAALLYSHQPAVTAGWSMFADARGAVTLRPPSLVQDEDEGGDEDQENQIPPEQVEKYIAVYKAMQRDHNLSVDQAASAQGLSVTAFRDIEAKIERDDLIRERVRQALRGESANSPSPSPAR